VATRFIFRGLAKKAISLGRADRITQHLPPRQPLHRKTEREESSPVPATGGGEAAATFQPVLSMPRWLEVTPNTTQDRNEGESREARCPACGVGGSRIIEGDRQGNVLERSVCQWVESDLADERAR
jgi:hypothetical protein